jgi:hypothetical protein
MTKIVPETVISVCKKTSTFSPPANIFSIDYSTGGQGYSCNEFRSVRQAHCIVFTPINALNSLFLPCFYPRNNYSEIELLVFGDEYNGVIFGATRFKILD